MVGDPSPFGPFCTRKLFPFSEVVAKNLAEQRRAMRPPPHPDVFEAASVHMSKSHPPKIKLSSQKTYRAPDTKTLTRSERPKLVTF